MRRLLTTVALALFTLGAGVIGTSTPAGATDAHGARFPADIPLPNGWRPEGLTIGRGTNFYAGSLADGAVFHGDLATGRGSVLVPGTPGTAKTGLQVDQHNRLWAAGAGGGDASVYDAASGTLLAHYTLTGAATRFINDIAVTPRAVYLTDSQQPQLYVVDLGRRGRLPAAARTLALSGPAADAGGFNNGIVATPTGRLIVVQTRLGRLVSVDPRTGASELVDLGGYSVLNGDGLVLRGRTLYVIRNQNNLVAVVHLNRSFTAGTVVRELTSPLLRVPTTGDLFGPFLYVVNARFDVTPTPDTDYDVVRLPS
jgi:sugar lactone lactonase YvrE